MFFFLYISNATGPPVPLAPSGPGSNVLIATNRHVRTWPLWQGQKCTHPQGQTGPKKKKKKKKKKKNSVLTYRPNMAVCFFFFFCTFTMPRGLRQHWPRLAPGQTCRLLAIGMFESGPYGRDPKCTPRGLVGNHKVWIMSFHHDKI